MRMRTEAVFRAALAKRARRLWSDGPHGGLGPTCGGLWLGTQGVPHGWQAWPSALPESTGGRQIALVHRLGRELT